MAGKGKKNAPVSLECMKAGYKDAKSNGDTEEEARWANQIGHAYKDKGEYVHALKWFRIDYEISSRRKEAGDVSATDLMPTCQSMGEIYLRLQDYDEALVYQERHYRLAQEANDLVEQQRASTQLGRTYLELYENQDNFSALQTAKDFFKIAMDLARRLKANPPYRDSPSYVKELVDAYNNMGLLKMASDDLKQARNLFLQGLKICDEEELGGNDDARSRIHHNLGRLFSDQRDWIQAKEHTLKDISICQKIPHPQGEAKGFINLGEMHFKSQNYEDAMLCFSRALKIAETLEDEDSLANTAKDNMNVVREAKLTMAEFHAGEQKLKKLQRVVESSRGSPAERSRLLQEHKALQELIGQAEELQAWEKHLELAKRAKKVVHQLGDSEKLGDAFGTIGCSYENLRFFDKAKKWHLKSWDLCRRVKHLEGQSVAKINYGNALDNNGEWDCALQAYKEAYQIASSQGKTKMLAQQISALENMQYSYYVRLDRVQDGRDVQAKLKKLKELKDILEREPIAEDEHCSETEDEDEDNRFSQDASDHVQVHVPQTSLLGDAHISQSISNCNDQSNESDELCTSSDALYQKENILKSTCGRQHLSAGQCDGAAAGSFGLEVEKKSRKKGQGQEALPGGGIKEQQSNKKRHRVILSDDEENEAIFPASQVDYLTSGQQADNQVMEHDGAIGLDDSTSNVQAASSNFPESKLTGKKAQSSMRDGIRNIHEIMSSESEGEDWLSKTPNFLHKKRKEHNNGQTKDEALPVNPGVSEEDCMHHNTLIHEQQFQAPVSDTAVLQENVTSSVSNKEVLPCGLPDMQPSPLEKVLATLPVSVGGQLIRVPCKGSNVDQLNSRTVDWLMEEVRSLYGKVMPAGPHPILEGMRFKGIMLNPMDLLSDLLAESNAENKVEAIIKGWIILPLVERYKVHCIKCRCVPNVKLIEKLERYQGSDDEVDASGCELDEGSVWPLMLALRDSETLSVINLSHNHLGSPTMNAIQELVSAHNLKDLGLKLDLHENKLGAGALTKICRCDVTLSRLEVLVLSKNRLGDAAARHVALILQQCSALVTLELEDCGLTTRTIQAIATALQSSSPLVKLAIGKNNPIAGSALKLLLQKLSTLCSFTDLDISNVELNEAGVFGVIMLLQLSSSFSVLSLKGNPFNDDTANLLSKALQETSCQLCKLDISYCAISSTAGQIFYKHMISIQCITHLNLAGNNLDAQHIKLLEVALSRPGCWLKMVDLSSCHLGKSGLLSIIQSLHGNSMLVELYLADNLESTNDGTFWTSHRAVSSGTPKEIVQAGKPDYSEINSNDATLPCASRVAMMQPPQADETFADSGHVHEQMESSHTLVRQTIFSQETSQKGIEEEKEDVRFAQNLKLADVADSEGEDDQHVTWPTNSHSDYTNGRPKSFEVERTSGAANRLDTTRQDDSHDNGSSISRSNKLPGDLFIQELGTAVRLAKSLQLLDLSKNGLSLDFVEYLFAAWSACNRGGSLKKHVSEQTVYFYNHSRSHILDKSCCSS